MTRGWRLSTFIVGTAALCILSRFAGDPAWDIPLSLLMAALAYWSAPAVVHDWVVRRRVTLRSILLWYFSTGAVFDLYQWWRTGSLHPEWSLGNLAGSTVLYLAAGLVWNLDLRQPRFWLPAGAVSGIGTASLLFWAWP